MSFWFYKCTGDELGVFWSINLQRKNGNGMVTIMARRYARGLTTKSFHLNMTRTLPCRNYTHCYWWGNWGLVRSSDFTTISNVAIKWQRWDINPSLSDTNFEFSTLYSSSICCTDKKAWPFDWDHLFHFIRSPHRLQLGSPKNLGTVKVGRFLLLSGVYMSGSWPTSCIYWIILLPANSY